MILFSLASRVRRREQAAELLQNLLSRSDCCDWQPTRFHCTMIGAVLFAPRGCPFNRPCML